MHQIFLERLTGGVAQHAFFGNLQAQIDDADAFFQRLLNSDDALNAMTEALYQEQESETSYPPVVAAAEHWLREVVPHATDEFYTDGRFVVAALLMEAAHRYELELAVRQLMQQATPSEEASA